MFKGGSFRSLKELGMFGKIEMSQRAFERIKVEGSIVIPEGCVAISSVAFLGATVKTVELPSTISYLSERCFHSTNIENLIFHGTKPPAIYGYQEFGASKIKHIYVPDESVDLYRSANLAPWLEYEPLSKHHS